MCRTPALIIASVLAFAAPADAEPISLGFTVRVDQRCVLNGEQCESFDATFTLGVTFDRGVTLELDNDGGVIRHYGRPSFSAVPLFRPDVHPNAERFASVSHGWSRVPGLSYTAAIQEEFTHGPTNSHWALGLGHGNAVDAVPTLTPESLVQMMAGTPLGFQYLLGELDDELGSAPPDTVLYFGQAVLQDGAAPIPEPSTLLLLSAGALAGFAKRRRRKREVASGGV